MPEDTGSKDECFVFLFRCTTRRLFIMIDFDFDTARYQFRYFCICDYHKHPTATRLPPVSSVILSCSHVVGGS